MSARASRQSARSRLERSSCGALLTFLSFFLVAGTARAQAVVVAAEDGGFDQTTVRVVRAIAAGQLRARGIAVIDDPRIDPVRPLGAGAPELLETVGVRRLFLLRIGDRLDQKVPLSFEEARPRDASLLFAATLTATGIDEADRVVPRLVDAVVDRRPAETNARIQTVTRKEGEPFNKRPGERFWVIGIPLEPLGFSIARWHEAERWRVGIVLEGAGENSNGRSFLGVDGAWLPSTGAISPYLGCGLGIVGVNERQGAGLKLEAGVELLRHHRVRLMLGADAVVPFFNSAKGVYPALVIRLAL
jgi:hypothetical protein